MASISGRLVYNNSRSSSTSGSLPGIQNVPIVLQDINSGAALAVLTSANGDYSFQNVPNGEYQIVEYFGFTPAAATPGDFTAAEVRSILEGGVVPPISYAPGTVKKGATHLDCMRPNTLRLTISGGNKTNFNMSNNPVRYTPITTIMDSNAVIASENLLEAAGKGTFGEFAAGTRTGTSSADNPYPEAGEGFTYVSSDKPHDGEFTVMNINDSGGDGLTWWSIADHTSGNETGRMMVVNGHKPGTVIFKADIKVKESAYYLFSTWILNLINYLDADEPALGVQVIDSNGDVLVDQTLGQLIPVNRNVPEWVQAGGVIYSKSDTTLTVMFVSKGPAGIGNDYAIDDIGLYAVSMPSLVLDKKSSKANVSAGDTIVYTMSMKNIYDRAIENVAFVDALPAGLVFVPGSVRVNGVSQPAVNPNDGFALPDVPGGETVVITFSAKVESTPAVNPLLNTAKISYVYTVVEGGIPNSHDVFSNEVPVFFNDGADLSVVIRADVNAVRPGDTLTYTITVTNLGPSAAENAVLTDAIPQDVRDAEYSLDDGATWQPWTGSIELGTMDNGDEQVMLVRGTVDEAASETLVNTAVVSSTTVDPVMSNNTSSVETTIFGPRCQALADVIESVASQEAALAHILNAEGEKIQAMVRIDGATAQQLFELNCSVTKLVKSIMRLEMILQGKLKLVKESKC